MPDKSEPSPVDILLIKNKRNNNGAPNGAPISVVTLKRTDTTLDLSQKAKRSCQMNHFKKRVVVKRRRGKGGTATFYTFSPSARALSPLCPAGRGPGLGPGLGRQTAVLCFADGRAARACAGGPVPMLTGLKGCRGGVGFG